MCAFHYESEWDFFAVSMLEELRIKETHSRWLGKVPQMSKGNNLSENIIGLKINGSRCWWALLEILARYKFTMGSRRPMCWASFRIHTMPYKLRQYCFSLKNVIWCVWENIAVRLSPSADKQIVDSSAVFKALGIPYKIDSVKSENLLSFFFGMLYIVRSDSGKSATEWVFCQSIRCWTNKWLSYSNRARAWSAIYILTNRTSSNYRSYEIRFGDNGQCWIGYNSVDLSTSIANDANETRANTWTFP